SKRRRMTIIDTKEQQYFSIPGCMHISRLLLFVVAFFVSTTGMVSAQKASTNSPYSKFGLGELRGSQLPQNRAMGGIETGVRYIGRYSNINSGNPASYSALQFTTIDAGVLGNISELA